VNFNPAVVETTDPSGNSDEFIMNYPALMCMPLFTWGYCEAVELALGISELNAITGCEVTRSSSTRDLRFRKYWTRRIS
jgi:hypothetical protein